MNFCGTAGLQVLDDLGTVTEEEGRILLHRCMAFEGHVKLLSISISATFRETGSPGRTERFHSFALSIEAVFCSSGFPVMR